MAGTKQYNISTKAKAFKSKKRKIDIKISQTSAEFV
jgi:hypothetical protein